ncbi:MAG: triose-phosphate isomerase family protein [Patescibacteria group bacterium]
MIIIANWKLNLTIAEVEKWTKSFNEFTESFSFKDVTPIICPSFIYIPYLKENLKGAEVGAQNISKFLAGEHTGEVSAIQLKDYVSYAIIGHSERRLYSSETDETIVKKAETCLDNNIIPIICISEISQVSLLKNLGNILVAFEPLSAIGSGNPDSPEHIENIISEIINMTPNAKVLYGGSTSEENVESFLKIKNLGGFLVGAESRKAESFINIIKKCVM